ncbi:MAG: hypothetical protein ACOC1G_03295 [Phycisphaeraceae bacterium]
MLYRLLRAAERANDLRVYQVGDLSIGVRPGRCVINTAPIDFAGAEPIPVPTGGETWLYLDDQGALQTDASGFPADRAAFVPLVRIVTDSTAITQLEDRRGEAFLQTTGTSQLGLTATASEINQALDGIDLAVTASNLNTLVAGALSHVDALHGHTLCSQEVDGEASFRITNGSSDANANAALRLAIPQLLPFDTVLSIDKTNGYLLQSFAGTSFTLLGVHTLQHLEPGDLTASHVDTPIGVVPADGTIEAVHLTLGDNLVTSDASDGIALDVKVNGNTALQSPAEITVANGSGTRSTANGDGDAGTVDSGAATVSRGDMLTIDLTRTVQGTLTSDASDAVALIVFRAARPN